MTPIPFMSGAHHTPSSARTSELSPVPAASAPGQPDLKQPDSGQPITSGAETFNRRKDWAWRLLPPALFAGLLTANTLAHEQLQNLVDKVLPGCLFHRLTGIACPGCGGTRAFKALLEGHVREAFCYNLLWIPTVVLLAEEYLLSWWLWLHPEQARLRFAKPRLWALRAYAVLVMGWFVLRNFLNI